MTDDMDYEGAILSGYSQDEKEDPRVVRVRKHQDHCGKCSNGIPCEELDRFLQVSA